MCVCVWKQREWEGRQGSIQFSGTSNNARMIHPIIKSRAKVNVAIEQSINFST